MNNIDLSSDHELTSAQIQENFLTYCRNGNYKQVVYLFDKYFDNPGFDLNCRDNDGNTPLILAARQGHGSIIQEILRFIPDISLENKKGHTVMHLSTISIQKMIFGSVSTCIKCSERLFCNACWLGNAEIVDRNLNKEQNRLSPSLTNLDGINCFHLTIKNMELLEGISIKIKWSYKPAQVLQSLLNHWMVHVGLNTRLLHMVASKCCNNAVETTRVLLKKNFSIDDQDEYEFTPIHHAARYGNTGVLELLISKISNHCKNEILDCPGKAGNTALHLAAIEGREECVRILLKNGAVIDLINSSNYTAAQCAKSVRIKNMLSQHKNGSGFINTTREKVILLPELPPFVLSRANTGLGHVVSSHSRIVFHQSGKKSAEPTIPTFREKSMSNPEMTQEFQEISMIEDSSPRRFPLLSDGSNATRSSELSSPSYCSDFNNSRSRLVHSIALERLAEEHVFHETQEECENASREDLVGGCEVKVKASNGDCDGGKKSKILTPAMRPKRAAIFIKKSGSTPNVSTVRNKSANKMTVSRDSDKKSEAAMSLTKSKLNMIFVNNSKKKITKKVTEQRGPSEKPVKSTTSKNSEPEVVYESDFNTDSSSLNEDCTKDNIKSIFNKKSLSESDDDVEQEDELNQTLTIERRSSPSRRVDQICWKRGEQLGKGSYGIVWKGMLENGQYIAVKEIAITDEDELSSSESSLKNIREIKREIEILQTIRHRNIVKYIGTCDSQSYIYIFMEFVSGGSIAYILSKFGGFSENIIRIYSRQIVSAVAFLHDRSIIHRDLKGANIMVTPKGVIKLVDFGCAKKLETFSSNSRSLTQQSRLQGSVYWLAPEVINGVTHSNKSDIWSIGCTVVEMIATKPPWSELHPYAAMFAIGTGKMPSFNATEFCTSNGDKLSWQINEFIDLCLTRDINKRSSASELLTSAFLK